MSTRGNLREQVVRKLGRLTEITRILDRNSDDGAFAREHAGAGELLYVFDTNVVQMFMEPFRNPQYAELFHGSVWGRDYAEYDLVNQQSCLLIAEYLLSGRLPGQRNGFWYMSTYHYRELREQMVRLDEHAAENALKLRMDDQFRRQASQPLLELKQVLALDPANDRERLIELATYQGKGHAGADELRALSPHEFNDRAIAVRTREICRLLSQDRVFEPVDQLRRFRSAEIAGRLRPIEQVFRPNREDLALLDQEADHWKRYLLDAIRDRPRNSRTPKALHNDCATLAFLSWAMRARASRHQKVVLVTGDKALYDAYRRRHIEESDGLPFLLRSLIQYAPLFNPVDASSSVAAREEAFNRVREAVEAATVALNLGLFGREGLDRDTEARVRDHFVLESEQSIQNAGWLLSGLFPHFFDDEGLSDRNRELRELVTPLQLVERLMLGAYPKLVAPRLETEREDFLNAANKGDGSALAAALQKRLVEARQSGFYFSLPLMPVAVEDLVSKILKRDPEFVERAALSVRLRFPISSDAQLSHSEFIRELSNRRGDLTNIIETLKDAPSRVFALAALLAFSLELWNEAARFADLAANASEYEGRRSGSREMAIDDEHYEYLYLKATSMRFRLAAYKPDPDRSFYNSWAQWLAEAESALTVCVHWHKERQQFARLMRALSERAAARLSYCAWFAFGRLGELRIRAEGEERLYVVLKGAITDLIDCDCLRSHAETSLPNSKRPMNEVFAIAVRQYRVNVVAARFIGAELLRKKSVDSEIKTALASLSVISTDKGENLPPIAQAYLLASSNNASELKEISTASLTLPLDVAIIQGLQRLICN